MENIRRLQIQTLSLAVATLATGTAGYYFIESGWSVFDAFYMTAITVTTVGYGEVQPLSTGGRIFSIFLIFFGLGSVAISATHMAQFIIQGELTGIFGRKRMQKQIDSLAGHYIVCGYGNIGSTICLKLFEMDLPFVVVESVPEALEAARGRGYSVVSGNPAEDAVLLSAGIARAHGLILCIPDDSTNIFISLAARELNPGIHIIARGSNPAVESRMLRAGADTVEYPLRLGGEQIALLIARQAGIADRGDDSLGEPGVMGYYLRLFRSFGDQPMTVAQVLEKSGAIKALALKPEHGEPVDNPGPDQTLGANDSLLILVREQGRPAPEMAEFPFKWSDEYMLGVDLIDDEHRDLFQYAQDFHDALSAGRNREAVVKLFDRLLDYTNLHFRNEEEVMRRAGYPDLQAHQDEHRKMTREVMELYKDKRNIFSENVADFLCSWLSKHILEVDRKLATFLKGKEFR